MSNEINDTVNDAALGGRFTFPGTSLTIHRIGYGAMQLAGPGVFGPPKHPEGAVAILREAVAAGVNHIDTSDFYGPHITNQIIRQALHPYPAGRAARPTDRGSGPPHPGSSPPASMITSATWGWMPSTSSIIARWARSTAPRRGPSPGR
jgi:hypothetical protein